MDLFSIPATGAGAYLADKLLAQQKDGRSFTRDNLAQFIDDALAQFHGIDYQTTPKPAANGPSKPKSDPKSIPPAPEDVTAYFEFIGYPVKGEEFCDSYETKGWSVGRVPMKNWQAACRNWKNNGWGKLTRRPIAAPATNYTMF